MAALGVTQHAPARADARAELTFGEHDVDEPACFGPGPVMIVWVTRGLSLNPQAQAEELTMPDYQHSCFISYKHPPAPDSLEASGHFWLEFVEAFEKKVNTYRQIALLTYRDVSLRSMGGVDYPAELARNLCRSVCMIAILTHEYMKSEWCRAEWRAMEQLEKARKVDPKDTGCIIPVLFRGEPEKAREFCGTRQFLDFRGIDRPKSQLDTVRSRRRVEAIGAQVAKLARHVSPVDCGGFWIDVGEAVAEPTFDDPNPLV